jgi:hypothetical protein
VDEDGVTDDEDDGCEEVEESPLLALEDGVSDDEDGLPSDEEVTWEEVADAAAAELLRVVEDDGAARLLEPDEEDDEDEEEDEEVSPPLPLHPCKARKRPSPQTLHFTLCMVSPRKCCEGRV